MSTVYFRFSTAGAAPPQRAYLLERLTAQAATPPVVADWRLEAYQTIAGASAPMPAIGAVALLAAAPALTGRWACVATPVHLVAGMTGVTMEDGACLDLPVEDAGRLTNDFNRVFGDAGAHLCLGRAAVMLCVFDDVLEVVTHDPADAVGHDVFGFQPRGTDAARLRRLMSEIEMWLFDHAVNKARAARSLAVITGFWLWGGGATLASRPEVLGWTAGCDPLFAALHVVAELPKSGVAGVVVCPHRPGSPGWPEAERRWLQPAVDAVRGGRIGQLTLSAGGDRYLVSNRSRWRFWRRARPWWESYGGTGGHHGLQ